MSYAVCQKVAVVVARAPVRSKSGFTLALMSRLSAPFAAAVDQRLEVIAIFEGKE